MSMKDEQIESTEYVAVWVALLQFSYVGGRPVDPHERNLCANLLQLGERYGMNGHQVAADLDKLHLQVERMPRTKPEHHGWFLATIEDRLKRRTQSSAVNLPAVQSPEARRLLAPLMAHATLEIAPEERRAREFERLADGDRFQAFQNCVRGIKGAASLEVQLRMETMLWMLTEGWHREFPVSGTVVKFEPRSETGQRDERRKA